MSNTVAGMRQFDNSQECIAKKRQWRRHANENRAKCLNCRVIANMLLQEFNYRKLDTTDIM